MESINKQIIKCVVWDLDNTLWDGILLEDELVDLRSGIPHIIETLDSRGILQSIASKNDYDAAMSKLDQLGLGNYFLYPQIGWSSKAEYIKNISTSINIGIDTVAFIDDQPFEREEVKNSFPEVLCIDAAAVGEILVMPEMNPRFVTSESHQRRIVYLNDMERKGAEANFTGPKEEFLATLSMKFTLFPAGEKDLHRAEELTIRTNQLNTTGYTYSYDELNAFRRSEQHLLLMAKLTDKFGSYGHIGLALLEKNPELWTIKLLLMSCRVMSRGVGSIMLSHIMQMAKGEGVRLQTEFLPNGRNRMMDITYRLAGFEQISETNGLLLFEHSLQQVPEFPDYVEVRTSE